MDKPIIGQFVPIGSFNRGASPFNVLTKEPSFYMSPAWEGVREGGEKYHVISAAWKFEPVEWDGEGLPPVGSNVEARFEGEWVEVTVAYNDCPESQSDESVWNEALVFNRITTRPFWADELRPIRSEADKKRDAAVESMFYTLPLDVMLGKDVREAIYDAIAAGKIPHIRID
ncbi:Uncharacterised protein [Lelliottia amnigena]|uniref:hypothetical protein n=1 Tax=Lelliottia amnigena TaxID=61646 RepID=UPI0007439FF6|nr:hypothetical protein [Lelliottia amnigena]ATG01241.1 hypothetical protein CO697_06385 [Lelliottia amnigena]PEG63419.1 hypothetical protein CRH15_16895 [Lelliottia amnigena]QXA21537.1 hypothetical protein I6L74_19395 [Lelliottia amnigena]VDZ89183.1 Uncharacterised protein [Lelliottia amnigena]